ncbi:MAG: hypothetical protein HKN23_06960 [Verrucomicrobiales bacterium]|nr:hypothetical protein [Verrucomicrobiales bacterium]
MDSSSQDGGRGGRSQNRNRRHSGGGRRGGRGGNRNQDRNRSGGRGRSSDRKSQPKKKSFLQKIFGFLGGGDDDKKKASRSGKGGPKGGDHGKKRPPRDRKPVEVTSGRLFVGNIDYDATDEALAEHFQAAGEVKKAEIVINTRTGKSKGFAFVEMGSLEEAKGAVEKLHNQPFMSRKLLISGAKSEGPKSGSGDGERRERSPRSRDRESGERSRSGGGGRDRDRGGRGSRDDRGGRRRSGGGGGGGGGGRSRDGGRASFNYEAPTPRNVEQVDGPALHVSNLSAEVTPEDLTGAFDGIGTVASCEIEGGTATIQMADTSDAQKAVEILHGKRFMGQELKITGAKSDSAPVAEAPDPEPEPATDETAEESNEQG